MKFEAEKSLLLEALQTASHAVPSKATLQILNNFLFQLEGNYLEISATDLDMGVSLKLEVKGDRDGSVVVNARKILDIVKELPDQPVVIEEEDYLVKVSYSNRFSANITGFDGLEFPSLPEVEEDRSFQVSRPEIQFLADKTLFAVSSDATRISLNGVYCEHRDNHMQFVATDGHRLGKAFIEHQAPDWEEGVIVPPKVLSYALKVLPQEGQIDVVMDDNHIQFKGENIRIISKLIEGPYPKYQNVIPGNFERTMVVAKDDFSAVIRRVATMANSRTRQIRFHLDGNNLEVSARNQDVGGESRENLSVHYEADGIFDIGFNANYLLEVLRMCPSEEVALKMNSPVGAAIIEPVGAGLDFFFLLMPLRLVDDA
jgi:DNA polymerase-3 subunit beta